MAFVNLFKKIIVSEHRSITLLQIVKEYERAVIFRLGRITARRPKGPGKPVCYFLVTITFSLRRSDFDQNAL